MNDGTSTATIAQDIPLVEFDLPLDEPACEPQSDTPLTFEELCKLEPRLLALYNEVRAVKDNKRKRSFCANAVWYGRGPFDGFKERLCRLVGYSVRHRGGDPRLATSAAYDVAYHTIYQALPDCRTCACWGFQRIIDARMRRKRRRYY